MDGLLSCQLDSDRLEFSYGALGVLSWIYAGATKIGIDADRTRRLTLHIASHTLRWQTIKWMNGLQLRTPVSPHVSHFAHTQLKVRRSTSAVLYLRRVHTMTPPGSYSVHVSPSSV